MSAAALDDPAVATLADEATLDERICQFLVARGRLKENDLARCRRLHEEDAAAGSLVSLLTRLGLVSEREMAEAVAELLHLPLLSAKEFPEAPPANVQSSIRFLKHHHVCPIGETEQDVTVLVADPADSFPLQALRLATGREVKLSIGLRSEIDDLIERYYGSGRSAMGSIVESLSEDATRSEDDIEHLRDLASEAPVIRLVNLIIQRAVEQRASDIHVEPFENRLKVRYRIDGVLHEVESPPAASTAAVISRIKIMAKLNIAERRLPQDGRIKTRVKGRELDLRVSTVPTVYGESVVMRVLDRASVRFGLGDMGFAPDTLERFHQLVHRPHGILLVTGPTGSGKTTTLYAALAELDATSQKIITVEDPVEYQMAGINQIQVHTQINLTFANALRSILRQDPDIIMIGEMRDGETAQIAVQSSLTGHLVLSTLHTNTAASAVIRMQDMGVERYLITSTVNGVLAQRLVRRLCPHCKAPVQPAPELLQDSGLGRFLPAGQPMYEARGCDHCRGTGYQGRTGIHELLVVDEALRSAILQGQDASSLHALAMHAGMHSLYEDGLRKVAAGVTSLDELLRVTQDQGEG